MKLIKVIPTSLKIGLLAIYLALERAFHLAMTVQVTIAPLLTNLAVGADLAMFLSAGGVAV